VAELERVQPIVPLGVEEQDLSSTHRVEA